MPQTSVLRVSTRTNEPRRFNFSRRDSVTRPLLDNAGFFVLSTAISEAARIIRRQDAGGTTRDVTSVLKHKQRGEIRVDKVPARV